jgi:hypothetical protein
MVDPVQAEEALILQCSEGVVGQGEPRQVGQDVPHVVRRRGHPVVGQVQGSNPRQIH